MCYKWIHLIVCELHQVHSFCNFWIEVKVKSNCTRELDVEDGEGVGQRWGVVSILVSNDGVVHANKHRNNNKTNHEGRVQVLALLLRCDQVIISVFLGVAENCVGEKIFFVLKFILWFDNFLPIFLCLSRMDWWFIIINNYWNKRWLFTLNIKQRILRKLLCIIDRNFVPFDLCLCPLHMLNFILLHSNQVHHKGLTRNID